MAVYYAGPAKTPEGYASGSFGPTTAGRMDSYVEQFQAAGGSMVMLAKGNRSKAVTDACAAHGGFYLGSIGGPAARLAQDCIKSVEVLEYPELGMEAVWKIEVEDFPAFIVVDDKGNDFFTDPSGAVTVPLTGIRVRSASSSRNVIRSSAPSREARRPDVAGASAEGATSRRAPRCPSGRAGSGSGPGDRRRRRCRPRGAAAEIAATASRTPGTSSAVGTRAPRAAAGGHHRLGPALGRQVGPT